MVPEQVNSRERLELLYEQLQRAAVRRRYIELSYAEHSDGHNLATHLENVLTLQAVVASNKIDRVALISGRPAAVGLRNNGQRDKLYRYLESGPQLVIEQGARVQLIKS